MGWWAKLRGLEEFEPRSKDDSDVFTDDQGVTWGPCGCNAKDHYTSDGNGGRKYIGCPNCNGTGMVKIN